MDAQITGIGREGLLLFLWQYPRDILMHFFFPKSFKELLQVMRCCLALVLIIHIKKGIRVLGAPESESTGSLCWPQLCNYSSLLSSLRHLFWSFPSVPYPGLPPCLPLSHPIRVPPAPLTLPGLQTSFPLSSPCPHLLPHLPQNSFVKSETITSYMCSAGTQIIAPQ